MSDDRGRMSGGDREGAVGDGGTDVDASAGDGEAVDSDGDAGAVESVSDGDAVEGDGDAVVSDGTGGAVDEGDQDAATRNDDTLVPTAEDALEAALIETHHLANISGLDEAKLARRRLVEAQSASNANQAHDRLDQAVEYLELARLERRDCAAGFVEARELVETAVAGLSTTNRGPVHRSPAELLAEREPRKSLEELRREVASGSYQQLRHEVLLDETFGDLRREVEDPDAATDEAPEPEGDLDVERALALASLEMDIEESIQNARTADSEFEFLSEDALGGADEGEP